MSKNYDYFENLSIDEIRTEMASETLSPLEIAFARTTLKKKEGGNTQRDFTEEELTDKITEIMDFGNKQQLSELKKLLGDTDIYSDLSFTAKKKIMGMKVEKSEPAEKSTKPVEKPAKLVEESVKPAEKSTKPAEKSTKPAEKPAEKPAKPAEKPAKSAEKPAEITQTKSEVMRTMYKDGKTVAEISKALHAHYSFVWGVINRFKNK